MASIKEERQRSSYIYVSFEDWLELAGYDKKYSKYHSSVDSHVHDMKQEAKERGVTVQVVQKERENFRRDLVIDYNDFINDLRGKKENELIGRNNTLDSIATVYQKADRILSNQPITIQLSERHDNTPAFNDGKVITFNANQIKSIDDKTITSLHGLNYHELAHILFTPRIGSKLGKWASADMNKQVAFNILEDCRIEYYITLKYPSTRPFFVATVLDYLLDKVDNIGESFVLLAGRKYLPIEIRRMSALKSIELVGQDETAEIHEIVSEYRTLVFPKQYDRAQELIEKLIELMPKNDYDVVKFGNIQAPNGCTGREVMRNGRTLSEAEQLTLKNLDTELDDTDEMFRRIPTEPKEDSTPSEGAKDFRLQSEDIAKAITEEILIAKSDAELKRKVESTVKTLLRDRDQKSTLDKQRFSSELPTKADASAVRLFASELERIRIDSDPAWLRETPSGKLNVRRAMNADVNDVNKLFDRWHEGDETYQIEATVLIDRSGSMLSDIGSACRSAWIIKRAIEKIDGRVSVLTFSDDSRLLSSADDKAVSDSIPVVRPDGGTYPVSALRESVRIMRNTKAKTKLVFLLTDGAFADNENDALIKQLQNDGCHVALAFLTTLGKWSDKPIDYAEYVHGVDTFRAIATPADLVKLAREVVKDLTKKGK